MGEKPLCVVCGINKGKVFCHKACQRCSVLTAAEGTRKRYGLPLPNQSQLDRARFIRVWNKMRTEGATVLQIAQKLGINRKTVEKRATTLRKAGFDLVDPQMVAGVRKQPQPPRDRSTMRSVANEHGGGKLGITGCNCGPCLDRRREYRNAWNAANVEKVHAYRMKSDIKRGKRNPPPEALVA